MAVEERVAVWWAGVLCIPPHGGWDGDHVERVFGAGRGVG